MNDFNFYLKREVMPVLSSPADVEKLLSNSWARYLLIKQRDLAKLNMIVSKRILISDSATNATWNLIELK